MEIKKILWLEDQPDAFDGYISTLFREGYFVDGVESVSEAVKKLSEENYCAVIFDIKVLPGNDQEWISLDLKKREEDPDYDSCLGLELLYSLLKHPKARITLKPPINIDPKKIIVLSVVYDKAEELTSYGVPAKHIIYKSASDLNTLPSLIRMIEEKEAPPKET